MWDLKIDTRRLVEGFSTSVLWERPNILWNKADDWWNDNYVTDPSTAAFLSATGIIDPNKQNYVNNLVIALKNQGLWNKMKAVYPFVSEQRNLLNNTEDFSNSYWTKSQIIFTGGQSDASGGNNATKCEGSSATNAYIFGSCSTIVGETYTASVYIKGDSAGSVSFRVDSGGSSPNNSVNYTTSWQRFTYTYVAGNANSDWVIGGYNTWTGSETIYVYAPQLETGSATTSYQATINAQEQFAAAYKYNLKDPQNTDAAFRLKIFGSWTFTPTGAKPNGTNAYFNTNFNQSSNLTPSNNHISLYSRTDNNTVVVDCGITNNVTHSFSQLLLRSGGTATFENGSQKITPTTATSLGLYIGSALAAGIQLYKNGTSISSTAVAQTRTMFNNNIYLAATNDSTSNNALYFSSRQFAFASIGDGLTDAEAAAFYTIVQQFQTSMGRQINP